MAEKVLLPPLNNSNYSCWKMRMQMLLIRDDYWFVVEKPKPEPVTPAWTKANQKALATIVLFIDDSQMNLVKDVSTARDAWLKLKNYHEKSSMTSRVSLLKRICNLNLIEERTEEHGMEKHLFELEELFDRLQCAGQDLGSSLKIAMVLRSLPDSFDVLVTALETRKDEDLTMEVVKQKLLDEWQRRSERAVNHGYGNGESVLKSVVKGQEKVCYHCQKPGHFRRNCRLLRKQQNSENRSAAEANQAMDRENPVCFAVRKCLRQGCWFIDSGCSSHMTNDRQFFSTLDETTKVDVVLADGSISKSAGIGEGSVLCVDGDGNLKKILIKNVFYIPNLYSGLLSVHSLLQKGFSVEFGSSKCKIVDLTGKIVAFGESRNNLFELRTAETKMPNIKTKQLKNCNLVSNEDVKCPVNHFLQNSGAKVGQAVSFGRFGVRNQEELTNIMKIKEEMSWEKKLLDRNEEFFDCDDNDLDYCYDDAFTGSVT